MLFPGIDSIQLLTLVASEIIDSNQLMTIAGNHFFSNQLMIQLLVIHTSSRGAIRLKHILRSNARTYLAIKFQDEAILLGHYGCRISPKPHFILCKLVYSERHGDSAFSR